MTWCALGIALVTDALYVALIRNQAQVPPDVYTVPFVTVYLVALAALLGLSIAVRFGQATRTAMRGAAAGGLLVLGVIAAFSIGLPLIVGGILAGIAAARSARPPGRFAATLLGFAAAFVAVAVLIAGFEVTERAIVCPVSGTAAGRWCRLRHRALPLSMREWPPELPVRLVQRSDGLD